MTEARANTKHAIGFSFMAILSLAAACIIWSVQYLDERMEDKYQNMLSAAAGLACGVVGGSVAAIVNIVFKRHGWS